jgi:hypothetical protein
MNLKEKFEQWFINDEDEHYIGMINEVCLDHEKIAEDFAIGFAEWLPNVSYVIQEAYTTKELLEIYKKEIYS